MKKTIFFLVLFICVKSISAQCDSAHSFTVLNNWGDSVEVAWSAPADSFLVEFGPKTFVQGTGYLDMVYDTTTLFSNLQPCYKYDVYIKRFCSNGQMSVWEGPFPFETKSSLMAANYHNSFNHYYNSNCGDSLYPDVTSGYSFRTGTRYVVSTHPAHGAAAMIWLKSHSDNGFLFADGTNDTNCTFVTPWVKDVNGSKDAGFYLFSNNTTNPGDNVTLRIDVDNGVNYFQNTYTYSGDDPNWKRVFIDLNPYHSSVTNKLRLILHVDMSTCAQPEYNDFVIDELAINDSSTCYLNVAATLSRPTPATITIQRSTNISKSTYQWGPTGFTPNNGHFGDTTTYNAFGLFGKKVPFSTNWVYIKDTCDYNPLVYPGWLGPFVIDSNNRHNLVVNAYVDLDSNCIADTSDLNDLLYSIKIPQLNSKYYVNSGLINIKVNPGTYDIIKMPYDFLQKITVNSVYIKSKCSSDSVNTISKPITDVNFFKNVKHNYVDATLGNQFKSMVVVQGMLIPVEIPVKLINCNLGQTSTLYLTVDTTILSITNFGPFVPTNIPNEYSATVNLNSHYAIQKFDIEIKGKVDTALINSVVMLKLRLDSIPNEVTTVNNVREIYLKSVSAVDPNDKHCLPSEFITKSTDKINYRIRFQNTGNYPAHQVQVLDTLPAYLSNANFVLEEMSHKGVAELDSNNVLTFTFYDINLPDSTSNEPESHGFVDFTMYLDKPMVIGDSVANRAHIFFDYQPAVITNYAWAKMIDSCDLIIPAAGFDTTLTIASSSGLTVDFTSNVQNAKTVVWDFGDGTVDTGLVVSYTYAHSGYFTVMQMVYNACGDIDTAYGYVDTQWFSIEEEDAGFEVFPNPANKQLRIKLRNGYTQKCTLVSMDGKIVMEQEVINGEAMLRVGQIEAGSYLVRVFNPKTQEVKSRLIQIVH